MHRHRKEGCSTNAWPQTRRPDQPTTLMPTSVIAWPTMRRKIDDCARAQRDADSNFIRPLRHGVSHHAVNADRSQNERGPGENRKQQAR